MSEAKIINVDMHHLGKNCNKAETEIHFSQVFLIQVPGVELLSKGKTLLTGLLS